MESLGSEGAIDDEEVVFLLEFLGFSQVLVGRLLNDWFLLGDWGDWGIWREHGCCFSVVRLYVWSCFCFRFCFVSRVFWLQFGGLALQCCTFFLAGSVGSSPKRSNNDWITHQCEPTNFQREATFVFLCDILWGSFETTSPVRKVRVFPPASVLAVEQATLRTTGLGL